MLRTYIFKISLALWFISWTPILLLGLVSARASRYLVIQCAIGVMWLARIIVGIRWKLHGKLESHAIIASKHMSIMEIAVLMSNRRDAFFIIKRELLWIPIYGWSFWRMGFVGVNRASGATNMKTLADKVAKKIRSGMPLIMFPEGTRKKPGEGVRLRRGLLFIAEQAKIPIQPVGTDAGIYWPKHGKMTGGVANVFVEPTLPFDATLESIAESIARHSA